MFELPEAFDAHIIVHNLRNVAVHFALATLLVVSAGVVIASAQAGSTSYSGVVRDQNGRAVPNAQVAIVGKTGRTVTTDPEGKFTISGIESGRYLVTVTAPGFGARKLERSIGSSSSTDDIVLSVGEVYETVTAEIGLSTDKVLVPQPVSEIDREKVLLRAPAVMAQAVEGDVGVRMQKTSPTIGGIFVRGLTGKNVNIYVDGVRYTTSAQRGGINTFFNLNEQSNIGTVEILRGSSSAQYGSDALGGTVNLLGYTPRFGTNSAEFHGEINTRYNYADNSFGGSTNLSYGTDKLGGSINLAARCVNELRTAGGIDSHAAVTRFLGLPSDILGTRLPDTAFDQYGGAFKLNYSPNDSSQLTFSYARNQQDDGRRYDQLLGGDGNLIADLRNLMLDFGYLRFVKQDLGIFDTASVTVSFNSQREERVNQGGQGDPRGGITHQYERTNVFGMSGYLEKAISPQNTFVVGGDVYSEGINSPAFTVNPVANTSVFSRPRVPDEARYMLAGVYLQDTWDAIRDRLRFSGAVRYNYAKYRVNQSDSPLVNGLPLWSDDKVTFSDFSGRIGAVVRLVDELRFTASYSRGFRAPSMTDLGTLGLTGDGFEVDYTSAINLGGTIGTTANSAAVSTGLPVSRQRSELTNNYDAGLRYRNSRIEASSTYFLIDLNDTIVKQALILPAGAVGQTLGGQPITTQLSNGVVFVPVSTTPVLVRSNFSDSRITGFEFEFSARIAPGIKFSSNYTYVHAKDKATGAPPNIEGGTPPPTANLAIRYENPSNKFWVEFYSMLASKQDRLSTLDLSDRRTGATRSRSQIANFIRRGACVRGITSNIGTGGCGATGAGTNYIVNSTGETITQVQDRVLGVGVDSAAMFTSLPGYALFNLRGGVRVAEKAQFFWTLENIFDQQYRNPSWGIDGAGRSFGAGFRYSF